MKTKLMSNLLPSLLIISWLGATAVAQNTRVDISKHARRIPKSCEGLTPAKIDGDVDLTALTKEAICKGAGDMLAEYTYTVNSLKREKDKEGKVKKEEAFVYEVFIPTLKSGMRTRGVLVVTSHNGVPVPPAELEKSRLNAAERIEKEEERIARNNSIVPTVESVSTNGMLPLGTYTRMSMSHSSFGVKSTNVVFAVADFLRAAELKLLRRENVEERETLIFSFTPRADVQFADEEKYMAQITGEIWIDAADRIVTRLIGWPMGGLKSADNKGGRPPALLVEMMRLPQPGIWLPRSVRLNGADYQTLFKGITSDSISTYSNYIRFSTEVKDAEIESPKPLQ